MVESVLLWLEGSSCAINPGLMTGNFKPLLYTIILKSVALKVYQREWMALLFPVLKFSYKSLRKEEETFVCTIIATLLFCCSELPTATALCFGGFITPAV